jgi:hypothetical protein
VGDDSLQPPVGNALGVVSTQGGGSGGGERPSAGSMAGSGMDAPNLNMGRGRPRDRVGNDHVSHGWTIVETQSGLPDTHKELNCWCVGCIHLCLDSVRSLLAIFEGSLNNM